MRIEKTGKTLPPRKTFVCDICDCEKTHAPFQPLIIQKTGGDSIVSALVCREHFSFEEGEIVYTPALLKLKFEVENKAKELSEFKLKGEET